MNTLKLSEMNTVALSNEDLIFVNGGDAGLGAEIGQSHGQAVRGFVEDFAVVALILTIVTRGRFRV